MTDSIWNERYAAQAYAYGTEPNDFLAAEAHRIPMGKVLSLAEGEGRNAVYLAGLGYDVTGVDSSDVGLVKAQRLAGERGVTIHTVVADLAEYRIEPESWDGIVSIYCHLPPDVRRPLYRTVVAGLKPGGIFLLEAFTPDQLALGTGGPKSKELLLTLDDLRRELDGLEFVHAQELVRDVREGTFHSGRSAVVQVAAVKPSA